MMPMFAQFLIFCSLYISASANYHNCPMPVGIRPRHCKKICDTDDDCKGHKRCLCDGNCSLSCVNPGLTCHPLDHLNNGFIRTSNENKFGSNAEYSCHRGYVLIGPSQRRCQASKEWSGAQPICRLQVKCGAPPELPYAVHDGASFSGEYELETEAQYTCVPGYHRFNAKGLALAKCLLNRKNVAQWFGPDLKCKARACPDPGRVENGIREGDVFEYPHQVHYTCLPGFLLVGPSTRKCESNGEWTETAPICKATECPRPPDPLHGRVLGTSLTYQSMVAYSCKDGYRLVGQVQRICLAEGIWAGHEPKCEEIRCPPLPALHNGYIESGDSSFGSTAVFRCFEKMTHVGATEAKCLQNGQWSHPLPKCLGVCKVPAIENGFVEGHSAGTFVQSGVQVVVKCSERHEAKSLTAMTCHNATWSHVPVCEPLSCHAWPPRVPHARVVFTKSSHGSRAKYECQSGYRPNAASHTIKCLFGEWAHDGPQLRCIPTSCEHPSLTFGTLKNGQIMLEGQLGSYDFANYIQKSIKVDVGRSIVFNCEKGNYLIGSPKASCVNGEWMPKIIPKCVPQTHPMIEGNIVWDSRKKRSLGRQHRRSLAMSSCPKLESDERRVITVHSTHEISAFCRDGYEGPSGANPLRMHCSTDLIWMPAIPYCAPKACRIPTRLHALFLRVNDSHIAESGSVLPDSTVARMVCLRGFQLKGNAIIQCNKGVLGELLGECVPQECPIEPVPNGEFRPAVGSILHTQKIVLHCSNFSVAVECNNGVLQPTPTCQSNNTAYCIPPRDTTPAIIYRIQDDHKLFLDRFQSFYPNGTVFQYKCEPSRDEASGIECVAGKWISNLLPCLPENTTALSDAPPPESVCAEPPLDRQYRLVNIDNYIHSTRNRFPHGTVLQVGCNIWAPNDPTVEWRCRRGKWHKKHKLACPTSMACDFFTDITGQLLAYSSDRRELLLFNQRMPEGSVIVHRCMDIGRYRLRGKAESECRDGEWTSRSPRCELLEYSSNDNAPPITFSISNSPHAVSYKGELIVARAATVTFNCLFARSLGKPKWETTSTYRTYPQIWTEVDEPAMHRNGSTTAFQLTVAGAQKEDGGLFHCITPYGERHSIRLIVQNVKCPPISNSSHLHVFFTQRTLFVGTVAQFTCPQGFAISGARQSTCLETGRWSHSAPQCQAVQCPPLILTDPHLNALVSSYKFGGIAQFSCLKGYTLMGNGYIHCTAYGAWSERVPHCAIVQCGRVLPPLNGFIVGGNVEKIYHKGDIVMFGCADSHILTGTDFVMCQATGQWTPTEANCAPYCKYPGTPEYGQATSAQKDYYHVGDRLVYYCPGSGYRLSADNVLVCIAAGKWNRAVPRCVPANED